MSLSNSAKTRLLTGAALIAVALFPSVSVSAASAPKVTMLEGDPNNAATFRYDPGNVTVKAGSAVVWANKGKQPHNAAAKDGAFDTGTIMPGATGQHRFESPGTYDYICTYHTQMTGKVTVTR